MNVILYFRATFTVAFFLIFSNYVKAQCNVTMLTDTNAVCKGENVTVIATFIDTVSTTFIDDNGQSGNMFDVVAKNDIDILAFDAHPDTTTNISVYYKKGSYKNTERDSSKWKLIGRKMNVVAQASGTPTRIPIDINISIKKGDTMSFYVTSTTSEILNYTNGTTEYKVYAGDRNLSVLEGLGVMWPFGGASTAIGIYRPRIFNGNIIYEPTGAKSYKWSNNMKGDTITITPDKSFELKVEGTVGACTSIDSIEFDVEDLIVNLGNDTSLCLGNSIQLDGGQAPKGTVYNWKPGGLGARYKSITSGGQKSVNVVSPRGCKYLDTIEITEKKSPNVDLGADIDLCDGKTIDLDAGNFGSLSKYSWNTNDTSRTITVSTSGRYIVTVTDSFGCNGKDNVDVTIRQNPKINLGADKEVCEGDTIILSADFADNNTTYNWSTSETTKDINITNTNGYKVIVTSEYGCLGEDSVYYLFHGLPKSGMNAVQETCKGNVMVFDAGNHGIGTKYEWSTAETTRSINVTTNGDYSVLITDSFGCKNLETITAKFRKIPNVNLGIDLNFCEGKTEILDAAFDDGFSSYKWSTNDTTKTIEISQSGTYSVLVIDSFGCENTDEIEVLVLALPKVDLIPDTSVCNGATIELDAGKHDKYNWNTNETTQTITVGVGTYKVTVANVFGCENSDSVSVTVAPDAVASFTGNDLGGQKVEFTNNSTEASTYSWDFGDGNTSTEISPTHWYKEDGRYTVKLIAYNKCGDDESSEDVDVTASGLLDIINSDLTIYPNPTSGNLFLMLNQDFTFVNAFVYEISGRKIEVSVLQIDKHTFKLSLPSQISKGAYVLQIVTDNTLITENFMVE